MSTEQTVHEPLEPRDVLLGRTTHVRRLLPHKDRRMIGAWCFLDHYGPDDIKPTGGMWVPPHPHTGLQTVTWLFEGLGRHTDSLGSDQLIRPGQLNVMTAGHGICHAEVSPEDAPRPLHGVQLWVALPDAVRDSPPGRLHPPRRPARRRAPRARGHGPGRASSRGTPRPLRRTPRSWGPRSGSRRAPRSTLPLARGFEYGVLAVGATSRSTAADWRRSR